MEIPRKITDKHLEELLCAGRVIKRLTTFQDGNQSVKRLIVLTNDNELTILAITTTTNISPRKYYNKDDILIKANQEKTFESDTYIQLNRIIPIHTEVLKEEFNKSELDNLGKISDSLLENIYFTVEQSEVIEQKYIDRIINGKKE